MCCYLIIRADANVHIGAGHLMRCLALAQGWQDVGGRVVFLMAIEAPALEARLKSEGMEVIRLSVQPGSADDATRTADFARQVGASWIVVDGYHFGADYQRIIKDSELRLLVIDDNGHADRYYADIVLNQNIHADEGLYVNREPHTKLLLGSRYVLLREKFLKWRGWKRETPDVARRVLVTLGGADHDNVTLKVIRALQRVAAKDLEVLVVVGENNRHYEELQRAFESLQLSVRLECSVTNMPDLMAWADVAVSAGGSTCWEMALMGLPALLLITAHNQRGVVAELHERGVGLSLGWWEQVGEREIAESLGKLMTNAAIRAKMTRIGQQLVDGWGVERTLASMNSKD